MPVGDQKLAGMARQRGAALLIALLAVTLAALLAVELVERSQRDIARTTGVVNAERAWQFAVGVEGLARDWIRRQREAGARASPLLDGQWSQPFAVPGGSVRGRMLARDGRFNLNALASRDPALAVQARRTLAELLESLEVDPALLEDIGSLFQRGGAGPPIRLAHLSELHRLERYTSRVQERLRPYLVVLPDPETRLNINRARPEVLAAVLDGLAPEAARSLLARAPFETLDEVLAQPELAQLNASVIRRRLTVTSEWFLVEAEVVLDGTVRNYFRLVAASGSGYDFRYLSQGVP
jgi:general secretion pathway protein K